MREILFRGKDVESHKWVCGSLIEDDDFCCILDRAFKDRYEYPDLDGEIGYINGQVRPVIPETLGQFTGLLDDNGEKIFEGDIIKCSVVYDIGCYPHTKIETRVVEYKAGHFNPLLHCDGNKFEVIGNIHDNPELLEKE